MWGRVRTILVVTLVTGLIWIWADAETQKDDLLRPGDTAVTEQSQTTVASVPVLIAMPASARAHWSSVTPDTTELKRVTIAGPRDAIERIRENDPEFRVAALLVLDEADLTSAAVSKTVDLTPPGAGLRFVGPTPTVRVKIGQ